MKKHVILTWLTILFSCLCSQAVGGNKENIDIILKGAGATFPYPLYNKWMQVYEAETGVRITYQSIGSGGGIRELLAKNVDFGATDAFLNDKDLAKTENPILHIPTCLGAVAIVYNLPGNPQLKLTPALVSGIFLGKITNWSDERLKRINPGAKLPDLPIHRVHRSDSSGTTFIFSSYLQRISTEWKEKVGAGKEIIWPGGIGVERNPGVVKFIKKVVGSLGYVEMTYARNAGLPMAEISNRSGYFVKPTLEAVSQAARVQIPGDTRTLIIDSPAKRGYPISAFTWLIFYQDQAYNKRSLERARALARFLFWVLDKGQRYNKDIFYAPLSSEATSVARKIVRSMEYNGEQLVNW